jgi:hypothetical protein
MVRRLVALLVLSAAVFAATACTSPTAPKSDCAVVGGSGTCTTR